MANPAAPASDPKAANEAAQPAEQQADQTKPKKKNPLAFVAGLSAREKMIGAVALCVLMFFALDWMVFKPLNRHSKRLSVKIQEKEDLIPKRLALVSRKDEIEAAHASNAAYLTDAKVSQEEEIAAYLGEIERVSQSVGLFISNINPVQIEEAGVAYHLKVDVEGASSIANIKKFISTMEASNPSVRISAISLRSQGPNTEELRFRFSVVKLGLKTPA